MTAVRDALWVLGVPVRALLILLVRVYRLTLSGLLGGQCRFYPTCSRYAEDAILEHGAVRGTGMAIWRLARCGPFMPGGVDHVRPGRRSERMRVYDNIIHREAVG